MSDTWKYVGLGLLALVILGAVFGVLLVIGTYNNLVSKDVAVETAKGYVQSAYQRRADLIPQLVGTVQGSADFEKSTLVEIAAMRSQADTFSKKMENAKTLEEKQAVDEEIGGFLSRLMVVVEAYPNIKSTEAFFTMQSQIEGTENRINTERNNYNDAVRNYKMTVRTFPNNIIAGWFGFDVDKWQMFEAKAGAEDAPKVAFDFK